MGLASLDNMVGHSMCQPVGLHQPPCVGRLIAGDEAHAINDRLAGEHLTGAAADPVGAARSTVADVAVENHTDPPALLVGEGERCAFLGSFFVNSSGQDRGG